MNADLLQGSIATFVKSGGIFNDDTIANLHESASERLENWLALGKVTGKSIVDSFSGHGLDHIINCTAKTSAKYCNTCVVAH